MTWDLQLTTQEASRHTLPMHRQATPLPTVHTLRSLRLCTPPLHRLYTALRLTNNNFLQLLRSRAIPPPTLPFQYTLLQLRHTAHPVHQGLRTPLFLPHHLFTVPQAIQRQLTVHLLLTQAHQHISHIRLRLQHPTALWYQGALPMKCPPTLPFRLPLLHLPRVIRQ